MFFICCFRYVEEHVQKTGVAIETQGFSFVTSGRKRESLTVINTNTFNQTATKGSRAALRARHRDPAAMFSIRYSLY